MEYAICVLSILLFTCIIALIINIIEDYQNSSKEISFKENYKLIEYPIISLQFNDKLLNFLIDTGSNVSHINYSAVADTQLEPISKSTYIGVEGRPNETCNYKLQLNYGDYNFENVFCGSNLDAAFDKVKKKSGIQLHGILGGDFLSKYHYVIDYNKFILSMK